VCLLHEVSLRVGCGLSASQQLRAVCAFFAGNQQIVCV
jgi:hypothetical protein